MKENKLRKIKVAAKIVSKSASVSDIKDEIQNIDLKASAEIPEEMNEQF